MYSMLAKDAARAFGLAGGKVVTSSDGALTGLDGYMLVPVTSDAELASIDASNLEGTSGLIGVTIGFPIYAKIEGLEVSAGTFILYNTPTVNSVDQKSE